MGIMEALNFMVNNGFLNINTNGSIYVFAQLFSNTAYTFLPILIAYSGAKVFGANPYLGAVIGMIMIHPSAECLDCCNRGCAGNAEGMVWTLLH